MKKWLILLVLVVFAAQAYAQEDGEAHLSAEREPEVIQHSTSPDGQWQTQVIRHECANASEFGSEILEVSNIGSGESEVVATQDSCEGGIGPWGFQLIYWGETSEFLDYTDSREGGPDGDGSDWQRPLYRLNLNDMSVTPLEDAENPLIADIMAASEPEVIQNSTSPDGQWQAQIIQYDCVVVGIPQTEMFYEMLEVSNVGGGEPQFVARQLRECNGAGSWGLKIVYWDGNSEFMGFHYGRENSGPPLYKPGYHPPIRHLNFSDMSVTPHYDLILPAADTVLVSAPVFSWESYPWATRYVLKVFSADKTYKFKKGVKSANACTGYLCTFVPDFTTQPLPDAQLKWRVIGKDQQTGTKQKSEWRSFSLAQTQN